MKVFIDIDGVLLDFYGTAKKFGIELEVNCFGKWKWGEPPYPAPEEFYAYEKADVQPWFFELMEEICKDGRSPAFITKDFAEIKRKFIVEEIVFPDFFPGSPYENFKFIEATDKSAHCKHPTDLLIDDSYAECKAWSDKGGIAYHFDLASKDPFEDFIQWWEMRKC